MSMHGGESAGAKHSKGEGPWGRAGGGPFRARLEGRSIWRGPVWGNRKAVLLQASPVL